MNSTQTEPTNSIELGIAKVGGSVALLALSIIVGLIPIFLPKSKSSMRKIGLANSFSGGIFLAISLVHLYPESGEYLESITDFPLTSIIVVLSYSFVLVIEKILFDAHKLLNIHVHPDKHQETHHGGQNGEIQAFLISTEKSHEHYKRHKKDDPHILIQAAEEKHIENEGRAIENGEKKNINIEFAEKKKIRLYSSDHTYEVSNKNDIHPEFEKLICNKRNSEIHENSSKECRVYDEHLRENFEKDEDYDEMNFKDLLSRPAQVAKKFASQKKGPENKDEKEHALIEKSDISDKSAIGKTNPITPFILLGALSFHGLFEGIAVGLQSSLQECLNLLIAVSLHKWAESLTLAISFMKNKAEKSTSVKMIVLFSITGPAGILLGWAISGVSPTLTGVFMAISAGTFLYISTSEIVVEEFSISRNKWLKYFFYLLGICFITGLWFLE